MCERQRPSVQPLTFQPKLFRKLGISTVGQIAAAGVMQRRKVHPNLVWPAGFQMYVEETCGDEGFDGVVVREAVAAIGGDGELPVLAAVAADRRIDRAAGRIG